MDEHFSGAVGEPLILKMERIIATRGVVGLVTWVKSLRLALLHYLSGESLHKRVKGQDITTTGYPKALRFLNEERLVENIPLLRYILTILFSTRALKGGPEPGFESICTKGIYSRPHHITKHVRTF